MAGVNKVILIGNLGRDPELRRTPSGTSVASFSIATSEKYTDKSGARQERTEWHNIVLFNKLAELAGQYLSKGRTVYIEGRLQTTEWEDKNGGGKRCKTEVVGNQMQFLSSNNSQGQSQESFPQNDFPDPVQGMDEDLPF